MSEWPSDPPGEQPGRPVFYPDADLLPIVEHHVRQGIIEASYEVTIRSVQSGETVQMLVLAPGVDLDAVHASVRAGLNVEEADDAYLEPYFWLFWRGWAGRLDAPTARLLPLGREIVEKIVAGVPLRGADLEALASGLGWFHAMNAVNWGSTDNWNQGTLSTPHSKSRKTVRNYVIRRMIDLYGEDYAYL